MKKITLLTLLSLVGLLGASQLVYADTSILFASPASLNSTIDTPFNISVQLNPSNNKVCVVTGTLDFNSNLSCQSISVTSGIMAIITPTCTNPNFILGIPKCTTAAQNLFSISAKGIQIGQGTLNLAGVKVIGAGTNVVSNTQDGAYNIIAATTQITTPNTTKQATQPTQQTNEQTTTSNQQSTQVNTQQSSGAEQQASLVNSTGNKFSMASLIDALKGNSLFWIVILLLVIVLFYIGRNLYKKYKKTV